MSFLTLSYEAWISIRASRLRAFLAMLGIVIGVGSVVLMLAIGAGGKQAVEESIRQLGTNLLIVSPGVTENKGVRSAGNAAFTLQDVDALGQIPVVNAVAGSTVSRTFQVVAGKLNWNTTVTGVTPPFFDIRNWTFDEGEPFAADDIQLTKHIAIVGATVVGKLFPEMPVEGVMGRMIHINGVPFKIGGILTSKGAGFDGRDQDDTVFVPITTMKVALSGQDYMPGMATTILVQTISADTLDDATEQIISLLRQRYHVRENGKDNAIVNSLNAITQVASDTTQAFSMLLGAIASISLVVGGIGIMNIMLVNVTERTREIGVRKAIGATERQILLQFLLEAIIIASLGSFIGLVLGVICGVVAEIWFQILVAFSLWSVLLALGVAMGVGVASGLYPASKAARLHPTEALATL